MQKVSQAHLYIISMVINILSKQRDNSKKHSQTRKRCRIQVFVWACLSCWLNKKLGRALILIMNWWFVSLSISVIRNAIEYIIYIQIQTDQYNYRIVMITLPPPALQLLLLPLLLLLLLLLLYHVLPTVILCILVCFDFNPCTQKKIFRISLPNDEKTYKHVHFYNKKFNFYSWTTVIKNASI